jgi:hypothetical protein
MLKRPVHPVQDFVRYFLISICALFVAGCGSTKWSDTARTGTEQLLISNAIDRAVGKIDFSPMRNRKLFLKTDAIAENTDHKYLSTLLKQQIAADGGILCAAETDADYIVEVRAGAIGTDRDDMLVGIPAMSFPSIPGSLYMTGGTTPEIPFIKRTRQRGIAKIALFAYHKETGRPLWASGDNQAESSARNLWFAGTGPLTRGTIYKEATFAGGAIPKIFQLGSDQTEKAEHERIFSDESIALPPPSHASSAPILPPQAASPTFSY